MAGKGRSRASVLTGEPCFRRPGTARPDAGARARPDAGYTAVRPTPMTPTPDDVPRVIDTRGDESLAATFVAVMAVEALVLAGLWLFSRYFSG